MKKHLKLRGRKWHFNIAVPNYARKRLGKETISYSLNTYDSEEAAILAQVEAARWKQEFRNIKLNRVDEPKRRNTTAQQRETYRSVLQESSDPSFAYEEDQWITELDGRRSLRHPHHAAIEDAAFALYDKRPKDGQSETEFQAAIDAEHMGLQDAKRVINDEPPQHRKTFGETFQEFADGYYQRYCRDRSEGKKRKAVTESRKSQIRSALNLFGKYWRDKPLTSITRRTVATFLDDLGTFDAHWGNAERNRAMNWADLYDTAGNSETPLSGAALNRHVGVLEDVWESAMERGAVPEGINPFKKKPFPHTPIEYAVWTIEQLNQLLSPPIKDQAVFEIAYVGLYTGARIDEIASLTWDQICEMDGVWFFNIHVSKTDAGVRKTPLHDRLIWLVERKRKLESQKGTNAPQSDRIWPTFKPRGPDKKPGADASRKFKHHKKAKGFTGRELAFHSFRSNASTALDDAGLELSRIKRLVGHKQNDVTADRYIKSRDIKQRREEINKIKYEGLSIEPPSA